VYLNHPRSQRCPRFRPPVAVPRELLTSGLLILRQSGMSGQLDQRQVLLGLLGGHLLCTVGFVVSAFLVSNVYASGESPCLLQPASEMMMMIILAGFNAVLTGIVYMGYHPLILVTLVKPQAGPFMYGVSMGITLLLGFISLMTAVYW
jgi:hypothetical protein